MDYSEHGYWSGCKEGGTLIVSYICRLLPFLGFKILNYNILGVFRKMNSFGGMNILWLILLGSLQNWTRFRGHFYAF